MSFLLGGKGKEKDAGGKKSQFYVEFLGWMECRGVRGRKYTDPIIAELRRRNRKLDKPPKLTIQLTPKELRITQDVEEKRKRSSIKKIKFPAIPARDVTYVVQATRPSDGKLDDVVACIYLGYMPRTQHYVHVHVYRFDEPSTAATFTRLMSSIVDFNLNRINGIERDLAERGEIEDPRLASSDGMSEHTHTGTDSAAGSASESMYSEDESPTFGSDDMDADLQSLNDVQLFDSVAAELKQRLKMADGPLLLPPKDYDTISRARGNLKDINGRRCLNLSIVGEGGPLEGVGEQRGRNGSEESGIDLASPGSDGGDVVSRFPPYLHQQPSRLSSGSSSPSVVPQSQVLENGSVYPPRLEAAPEGEFVYPPRLEAAPEGEFVYPPRHEAAPVGEFVYPPRPEKGVYPLPPGSMSPALHHVRQSSQSSTHSSRASRHSDGNNSGDGFPIYRRTNSSGSSSHLPPDMPPPHMPPGGYPARTSDEFIPPTDYDEDLIQEPFPMRHKPFPPAAPVGRRPISASSAGSGPSGAKLTRSLTGSAMRGEMAPSPRIARRGVEGDEYFFNADRRAQPFNASQNEVDIRPHSLDYEVGGVRRVRSMYR